MARMSDARPRPDATSTATFGCLLALSIPLLALAGCVAEPDPTAGSTTTPEYPGPQVVSGPVSLLVARPGAVGENDASQGIILEVPHDTTYVLLEARWSCTSSDCAFYLQFRSDGQVMEETPEASGAARLERTAPEAGTYDGKLRSAGPAVGMEGEIRATFFFSPAPPAADYSAFA